MSWNAHLFLTYVTKLDNFPGYLDHFMREANARAHDAWVWVTDLAADHAAMAGDRIRIQLPKSHHTHDGLLADNRILVLEQRHDVRQQGWDHVFRHEFAQSDQSGRAHQNVGILKILHPVYLQF